MQLVAYGAQDVYLTGNPQITFFKVVYRRHTNFSLECIETPIEGANFGTNSSVQLLRNGDMANKMYIKTILPALPNNYVFIKKVGFSLIKNIECIIGGSLIDKHFGLLYDIWYELTRTKEQQNTLDKMIGNTKELTNLYYNIERNANNYNKPKGTPEYTIYIPLQFWFNRNVGLSLPLIALQYHDVRFNIEFEKLENLVCYIDPNTELLTGNLKNTSLLTDYIYLDQEERKRMAQVGHEYLIEQVQTNNTESITGNKQKFLLDFNHPCKEIVWVTKCDLFSNRYTYFADYYDDIQESKDYAAVNIVGNMISYLKDTDSPTIYTTDNGWYKLSDIIGENPLIPAYKSRTYTSSYINISFKKINITIKNDTYNDEYFNNKRIYYINTNMFKYDNINLCDKINEFNIEFYIGNYDNTGAQTFVYTGGNIKEFKNILNIKHQLAFEDISLPIEKFTQIEKSYSILNLYTNININSIHPFNYGLDLAGNGNLVETAKLQLNGQDRFDKQDGSYFNYVQPSQYHTQTPSGGIYCYSFGLNPEQHQPSGTCNLSRIDTTLLILTFKDTLRSRFIETLIQVRDIIIGGVLLICVVNYNVLRIMSGMCGIAYAN